MNTETCKHGLMQAGCAYCNPIKKITKIAAKPTKKAVAKSEKIAKERCMTKREFDKMCKGVKKDFMGDFKHDYPNEEPSCDVWFDMAQGILMGSDGAKIKAYIRKRANFHGWDNPIQKQLYAEILADDLCG